MSGYRAGVVFGGRSVEHEVSVVTAHQAMAALSPRHEVVPIYVTKEGRWLTGDRLNDLDVYRQARWNDVGEECLIPPAFGFGGLRLESRGLTRRARTVPLDVVVCAIHGTNGEDGTLQGLLELAGLPYTGSGVVASAVGLDKVAMKQSFSAAALPVVPHHLVDAFDYANDPDAVLDAVEATIAYPCFAKPARAGSSVGIGRADDRATLRETLEVARRYDTRVLVEKAMTDCIEVNCSVIGGGGREPRVSVCEQPVAWEEFLTFSDKYMRPGKSKAAGMASQERRIPAPISDALTKQVQDNALAAYRSIGASGVARIDAFVREESSESWVMEINTMPGSFSFYLWEATGTGFDELMEELIAIALEEYEARSALMVTYESGLLERSPGGKQSG